MLRELAIANRSVLIGQCPIPATPPADPEDKTQHERAIGGFLDRLIRILGSDRSEAGSEAADLPEIRAEAAQYGARLSRRGYTIEQVVHQYGHVCQAITQLALAHGAHCETLEFQILNRSLDHAIAGAVAGFNVEHDTTAAESARQFSNERLGFLAHELRNDIQTATLAFAAMEYCHTASTEASAILARSLAGLRKTIDQAFSEVRMTAGLPVRHEVLCLADFIEDVRQSSALEAQAAGCELIVPEVPRELAIGADRELLLSAVKNLLQNAFKFTQPHSRVSLTAHAQEDRILIEVRDHCGGLAPGAAEKMFLPFTQSGRNRSGLGLGLVIARRSVEANNGVLSVHDVPGVGCVFSIKLPRRLLPHWSLENSRRNAVDGPSDRASVETFGRPAEKSPMDQPGT